MEKIGKLEEELKKLIIERYGTVTNFSNEIGVSKSTMHSILQRGVMNANVHTIIDICKVLNISVDELAEGRIVDLPADQDQKKEIELTEEMKRFKRLAAYSLLLKGHPMSDQEKAELFDNLDLVVKMMQMKIEKRSDEE